MTFMFGLTGSLVLLFAYLGLIHPLSNRQLDELEVWIVSLFFVCVAQLLVVLADA